MNGTDELRKEANKADWVHCTTLRDIADRIDAEHEEAIQQALMGEGGVPATDENMAEHGWIRLPKDADDMPWNPGDRDEDGNVVTHLMLTSDGWYAITDGIFSYHPERRHHYHAPTVEDVLREFALKVAGKECMTMRSDLVDEYASKLQLREDA